MELNTFQIDDKNLTTNNVCEKSTRIFKMDDALVSHPSVYVSFFGWLASASSVLLRLIIGKF